jgi:uncharacterized protein (TIGR01244 family)
MLRRIDERMFVAGQIQPADVAALAAQGVSLIVNNRPDGEAPGQPAGAAIEAAAAAAGIGYCHIPVAGGFAPAQVEAMAEALGSTDGKLLAFCASGTRSTYLWGLARAAAGDDADDIIAKAADAGYDLEPLRRLF